MFEGIREGGNADLHVTSTGCDDGVAVSLCAGALTPCPCTASSPRSPPAPAPDEQVVLVGGRDDLLRRLLVEALSRRATCRCEDAGGQGEVDGDDPCNIVNRTLRGKGAQLELSEPLRDTMFADNTRPGRKHTTTEVFWTVRGRVP